MASKAEVITDVRRLLDEQAANGSGFVLDDSSATQTDADDTELDSLIENRIVEARNFVLGGCDVGLLQAGSDIESLTASTPTAIQRDGATVGQRYTVSSVLRLVRAQCPFWYRDITEFVDMGSADYTMLQDGISSGTAVTPKGASGHLASSSTMTVEVYAGTTYTSMALYGVKIYELASLTSNVKVSSGPLYSALVNYIAGLVCLSLGDERSDNFMHLATTYMGANGSEH